MFTIGEFASIGRVSIRMLRHYDHIGLLTPARVDPYTGYRFYDGRQFETLGRVLEFKDLGFRLDDVKRIVDGDLDDAALREMLAAKRAEVASRIDLDAARLRRLDARLQHNEGAHAMITVETKSLPAVRIAQISRNATGFGNENIGPVIGPMYAQLAEQLAAAGVAFGPSSIATYEALDDDFADIRVNAAFPVHGDVQAAGEVEVVDLPGVELAVTAIHHGSMATIAQTWEALMAWTTENGYQLAGICRENYLVSEPKPQDEWVTELQQPIVKA